MTKPSELVLFHTDNYQMKFDDLFLTFKEVLEKDNDWWEHCHNHIQAIFPTNKKSLYNPHAPLLTKDDIEDIQKAGTLFQAYTRFKDFISKSDMANFNHNHLRITRIIESFTLIHGSFFGFHVLRDILDSNKLITMSDETIKFWAEGLLIKF